MGGPAHFGLVLTPNGEPRATNRVIRNGFAPSDFFPLQLALFGPPDNRTVEVLVAVGLVVAADTVDTPDGRLYRLVSEVHHGGRLLL